MKEILKNNLPSLFNLLKRLYIRTPYYRKKLEKIRDIQELEKRRRKQEESKIINEIFSNELIIRNGPFKGMKYINTAFGSSLLPKILGSYEEPIQELIEEIIASNRYETILNIGCAEGYYACGFAMRLPDTNIIAYDIEEEARKNLKELKELNKLTNIEIKAECTHEELNLKSKPNTLVFCDIEGYEKILLDPIKVPNLKYVDILVETHDCFVSGITEELINRFYLTHTMRIIVDYPYRVKSYEIKQRSKELFEYVTNERRPKYMKFIFMRSIYERI